MFDFLLATYANRFSCFSFPVLFKASCGLWKWLIVTKGGIKFDLSLADLVLVVYSLCSSVYSSVEMALFHRAVSVWFHLMVEAKPRVSLRWCCIPVKCWLGREIASRAPFSSCSAGVCSSEARMVADKLGLVLWEWISKVKVTISVLKKRDSWFHLPAPYLDL